MGSGLSQEAEDTDQSKRSLVKPSSPQAHENRNAQKEDLPHHNGATLNNGDSVIDKSSTDQNRKVSHGNCFLVFARDLTIIWAEDSRYWHWSGVKETSEVTVEVAEMLNICWLEIRGKFEMDKLTPGIKYEVVFVVMLKDHAYGWEVPINVRLVLPDGSTQERKENLMEMPRHKWIEIPVGEFTMDAKKGGSVEFSLYEYEGGAWKRGLLVKNAAIRPKK